MNYTQYGKGIFGKGIYIGPYCVIGARSGIRDSLQHEPVIIGDNSEILSHCVISCGAHLGRNVFCDHYTYIGSHSTIADYVEVIYGAKIFDNVTVGTKSWIGGFICNNAVVEENCVVMGKLIHRFVDAVVGIPEKSPIIRKNAFVGTDALIIGDIEVGEKAYIGAGSVLTKSALPNTLYIGNPAKAIGPAPHPFKF